METNNNKRYWQIFVGALIVAIIVLVSAFRSFNQEIDSLAAVGARGDANASTAAAADAELAVRDQFPGSIVFVSSVKTPTGGWVVITDDANAVIGSGYFEATQITGTIDLLTPTFEGQNYFAGLYHDNGDRVFTLVADEKWLNSAGQPIIAFFRATRDLPEDKG
ncbi:MAG TPA: hypothetical protein VJH67_00355 [Candidatus Paceibacterota bacterium]